MITELGNDGCFLERYLESWSSSLIVMMIITINIICALKPLVFGVRSMSWPMIINIMIIMRITMIIPSLGSLDSTGRTRSTKILGTRCFNTHLKVHRRCRRHHHKRHHHHHERHLCHGFDDEDKDVYNVLQVTMFASLLTARLGLARAIPWWGRWLLWLDMMICDMVVRRDWKDIGGNWSGGFPLLDCSIPGRGGAVWDHPPSLQRPFRSYWQGQRIRFFRRGKGPFIYYESLLGVSVDPPLPHVIFFSVSVFLYFIELYVQKDWA